MDKRQELIDLMKLHGDYLKRTAYLMLKDEGLAEDMTQETFISYYKQNEFRRRSTPKTYLYRIMMNHIKMYLRKHKNTVVERDLSIHKDEAFTFEARAVVQMDLEWALNELKDKYKVPLILHYYSDFTIKEISEVLNCTESGVKMRLKRCRDQLKKILGKEATLYVGQ